MQIILVDRRMVRARTVTVKAQHLVAAAVLLTLSIVVVSIPNLGSSSSVSQRQEPKAARAATT